MSDLNARIESLKQQRAFQHLVSIHCELTSMYRSYLSLFDFGLDSDGSLIALSPVPKPHVLLLSSPFLSYR
eukprot:1310637-Amorphochlora_amoeboformis.AAC.1